MGVEGNHPGQTLPGPAPGPLPTTRATQTDEVPPGQARGRQGQAPYGVALTFAALVLAAPTQAQIIPTGTPAADILLSQAITEQRVFLTCSSLDSISHPLIVQGWQADATSAIAVLTANAVAPEAIAAFTEAAKPESLLPAADTPFEDVKQFCDAHPDWQAIYSQFAFTVLDVMLPKAFE